MRRLVLLLCLAAAPVEAATLYVNNSGSPACSDATVKASNSAGSPWCTIGRAAWGSTDRTSPVGAQAAAAGDIVLITAGTYTNASTVAQRFAVLYNPTNDGTLGNPITFNTTGGQVVLQASVLEGPVIGCTGSDYTIWDGNFFLDEANIEITPDTGVAVMHSATGCEIHNVTIDGNGAPVWADNHNGIRFEACTSCAASNNTIYDVLHANDNFNGAGIMVYYSWDSVIEHNLISTSGSGIFIKSSQQGGCLPADCRKNLRSIVRYNYIYDINDDCLIVKESIEGQYYQNICNGSDNYGISSLTTSTDEDQTSIDDTIINNTIYNVANCFQQQNDFQEGLLVQNNLCRSTDRMWLTTGSVQPAILQAPFLTTEHNHVSSVGTQYFDDSSANTTLAQFQSVYGHEDVSPDGTNGLDPLFVNAIAGASGDFRLCTGVNTPAVGCSGASPVLELGVNPDTMGLIPAGAYITNTECIGLEVNCVVSSTGPSRIRITPPDFGADGLVRH